MVHAIYHKSKIGTATANEADRLRPSARSRGGTLFFEHRRIGSSGRQLDSGNFSNTIHSERRQSAQGEPRRTNAGGGLTMRTGIISILAFALCSPALALATDKPVVNNKMIVIPVQPGATSRRLAAAASSSGRMGRRSTCGPSAVA